MVEAHRPNEFNQFKNESGLDLLFDLVPFFISSHSAWGAFNYEDVNELLEFFKLTDFSAMIHKKKLKQEQIILTSSKSKKKKKKKKEVWAAKEIPVAAPYKNTVFCLRKQNRAEDLIRNNFVTRWNIGELKNFYNNSMFLRSSRLYLATVKYKTLSSSIDKK